MTINTVTTLVGLLNAMIGGSMLVLPVLGMDGGYLTIVIGCVLICAVTGYTAFLLVHHLGKAKNVKYLILGHFGNDHTYTTLYNCFIWFSFLSAMILYFNLFCVQIQGLVGKSGYLPQIVLVVLIVWVICLRECDLSEIALASGISSVIGFLLFLLWAQISAPIGSNHIQSIGINPSALSLAFLNCYTTHDFLIQVIVTNPKRKDYPKIVILLYFIGMCVFLFTSYGAFGTYYANIALINRTSVKSHPQSIVDYFQGGQQQGFHVAILQLLYILHVLTTFPQYVIISKIRIFQLMQIEHSPNNDISLGQIIYIVIVTAICYIIFKIGISLNMVIDISGSIIGYMFAIFIPIWIHLKCLHYDKSSGFIKDEDERNMEIVMNDCECDLVYSSRWTMYLQTAVLLFLVIFGLFYFMSSLHSQLFIDHGI